MVPKIANQTCTACSSLPALCDLNRISAQLPFPSLIVGLTLDLPFERLEIPFIAPYEQFLTLTQPLDLVSYLLSLLDSRERTDAVAGDQILVDCELRKESKAADGGGNGKYPFTFFQRMDGR